MTERIYLPRGGVKEFPIGFTLPTLLEFKRVRSTINTGHLEEAEITVWIEEYNPMEIYSMATDDNWCWWESDAVLFKVWGEVELFMLRHVYYNSWLTPRNKWKISPYATSVKSAEFHTRVTGNQCISPGTN